MTNSQDFETRENNARENWRVGNQQGRTAFQFMVENGDNVEVVIAWCASERSAEIAAAGWAFDNFGVEAEVMTVTEIDIDQFIENWEIVENNNFPS